jgi:hypothetical protein
VGEEKVWIAPSCHHLTRRYKIKEEWKGMPSDTKASLDESRTDSDDFESGEYYLPSFACHFVPSQYGII